MNHVSLPRSCHASLCQLLWAPPAHCEQVDLQISLRPGVRVACKTSGIVCGLMARYHFCPQILLLWPHGTIAHRTLGPHLLVVVALAFSSYQQA